MVSVQLLIACRTAFVNRGGKDRMDVDPGPSRKTNVAVQTEPEGSIKLNVNDAKQIGMSTTSQDVCSLFDICNSIE